MWHAIIAAQIAPIRNGKSHIINFSTETIVYHRKFFVIELSLSNFEDKYIAFMVLELLLFGITKDIIGESPFSFEIEDAGTADDLMKDLINSYPKLKDLNSIAIAVNGEYAQSTTVLKTEDEIALIPPVSGG